MLKKDKETKTKKATPRKKKVDLKPLLQPLNWVTTDRLNYHRSKVWYVSFCIFFLTFIVLSFIYGAWTFSLVLLALSLAYGFANFKKPKLLEVSLGESKIVIGNKEYKYSQIKSFWLIDEPPYNTLFLNIPKNITSPISVEIEDQNPEVIRQFLVRKVAETQGKTAGFIDVLLRLLKL